MQHLIRILIVCGTLMGGSSAFSQAAFLNPQTLTLNNGMRVVVLENHKAPVVYHSVWYRVGSADEDPSQPRGLAHFFEHMMFRGTKRFPKDAFSQTLKKIGGEYNAFTSWDCTAYHELVGTPHLATVMELEADRMQNLAVTPDHVSTELKVVAEERRMRIDNQHEALLHEMGLACLFVHHPYGTPVIGWPHDIQAYTAPLAQTFYKRWYQPSNAILIVAGDVTLSQVRVLAEKYFGKLPSPPPSLRVRLQEPPSHGTSHHITRVSDQTQLPQWTVLGTAPTMSASSIKRAAAMEILTKVLGGGKTSRLYQALVEEQKLASVVTMGYTALRDKGMWSVTFAPNPSVEMSALKNAFEKEMQRLKTSPVTVEELAQAKQRMLGGLDYIRDSLEGSSSLVGWFLTSDLPLETLESWPQVLESVTLEDVEKAVSTIFQDYPRLTTTLLPAAPLPERSLTAPTSHRVMKESNL